MSVKSTSKKTARVEADIVSGLRAGDRDRRAIGMQQLARRLADLLDRDRLQTRRQLTIVVEAETKFLDAVQERRNAAVGLEVSGNRANQVLLGLRELLLGGTVSAERFDLVVDRRQRTLHICWIDAGTHDERPFGDAWIEDA